MWHLTSTTSQGAVEELMLVLYWKTLSLVATTSPFTEYVYSTSNSAPVLGCAQVRAKLALFNRTTLRPAGLGFTGSAVKHTQHTLQVGPRCEVSAVLPSKRAAVSVTGWQFPGREISIVIPSHSYPSSISSSMVSLAAVSLLLSPLSVVSVTV